jgi:hypothetical protein
LSYLSFFLIRDWCIFRCSMDSLPYGCWCSIEK